MTDIIDTGQALSGGYLDRVPPNASPEVQAAAMNAIIDRLNQQLKTQTFNDEDGRAMQLGVLDDGSVGLSIYDDDNTRIFLGRDTNSSFVGKVSKEGNDALTADDNDLIFNAEQNVFKVVVSDTTNVSKAASSTSGSVIVYHNLGYIPAVMAYYADTGSALTGFNGNLPLVGIDDATGAVVLTLQYVATSEFIQFYMTAPSSQGFYGAALSYDIRYYLLQETAS